MSYITFAFFSLQCKDSFRSSKSLQLSQTVFCHIFRSRMFFINFLPSDPDIRTSSVLIPVPTSVSQSRVIQLAEFHDNDSPKKIFLQASRTTF